MAGWKKRLARGLVLFLSLYPTIPLSPAFAQVGHDPAGSPFRDITTTQSISLLYGRFAGARAVAPVSARPGPFAALRIESKLSGPLALYLTYGQAYSSRNQVNPGDTTNRVTGPIDQTLSTGDLAIVLNLTGAKRWHAFGPYLGVGFGLMNASPNTADPGGFRIGSNFIMVPTLGTRVFLGQSFALRLEARDYWLRYEWPLSYYSPVDSTGSPVAPVISSTTKTRQITHNFVLTAGLSYLFTF